MKLPYITLFAVLTSLMMLFPSVVGVSIDAAITEHSEDVQDNNNDNLRGLQIWPLPVIGNKNNNKIKRHYGGGGGHRGGGGRGGGGRGGGHRRKDTISGRSECVECKQRYSSSKCQHMGKCGGGGRRDGDRRDGDRDRDGDGRDRDGKWTSWKTGKSCKYGKSCKNHNRPDRNCKYNKYGRKSCKYSSPKGGGQNYQGGRNNNNRNRGD